MANSYRDLIVWQKSMRLVTAIYETTRVFPTREQFGLTSQLCRASVSIPSNIAEGQGRMTHGEFLQFLGHSRGSLFEVETQLYIARNLEYITDDKLQALIQQSTEVAKILNGLISSLDS